MYLNYSIGFLIASLAQAGIIMITELLGVSTLGARFTVTQILIHIIVGQIVGYILLVVLRTFRIIHTTNTWMTGSITGVTAWIIILSINSAIGTVRPPWTQGVSTVLSSLIAFIVFGIIVTYTIKKYNYNNAKI